MWRDAGRACVALGVRRQRLPGEEQNDNHASRAILEPVMKVYSAVIERCPQTGLFVGFVPGFPGAHSQGETLDEVTRNLHDVIAMLLKDGEPMLESEFVGVQNVAVA
jgi:predicted RNase H-like HicB family nuclease